MLTISFCHSFFIHFLVEVTHHLLDTGNKEGKQTVFFFFFGMFNNIGLNFFFLVSLFL